MKENYLTKKNTGTSNAILTKTILLFLLLFGFIQSFAQTSCATALPVTINGACITGATVSDGTQDSPTIASCPIGTFRVERWYTFTVTGGPSNITISAEGNNRNLFLQLISQTGPCTGLTQIGCANADNTNGTQTETINATALANGTYYIKVVNVGSAGNMTLNSLCVTTPPTITGFSAANGCPGTSLTINGNYLNGATAVTIGGTAATITANTATSVTVTIGNGTTGTVSVITGNGTATSAAPFTVNAAPANPANPTSNSPQCNPPGVTLTRAATPPGTENYYWQNTSLGTSTTSNSSTYNVTASGTYYIRSQTIATGCWSIGQGSLAVIVDSALNNVAISPNPAAGGTGICYSGSGPITSVSWTAAAGASSYDVYFGAGSLPGSVTSNVATTSYNTGALLASTTYYWKIIPRNSCGASTGAATTWTFTTAAGPCTCTPTGNLTCTADDYISNVTLNSLNNTTTCGAGGYTIYPASGSQTTTLVTGQPYTFSLSSGPGFGTHGAAVWFDFNQNGVFTDAGEYFLISNTIGASSTTSITITIPAGANLGAVKMRVRYAYSLTVTSAMSCTMGGTYGETEDYTVTLIAPVACTTPTAQPTALTFPSKGSTTISGSFTAASPAPSGYIIVRSTSATAPTLTNGTTYAVGYTGLTPGTTYVIQGSSVTSTGTTFTDTGLASNTRYYYYIFSYNNACTGTPFYLTATPLSNNAITCPIAPTAPVNSAISGTGFTVSWTAQPGGGAATINYTIELYADSGYTTPVGSPIAVGTGTTYTFSGLNGGTIYYYRIKANNGSCDSPYLNGNVTTTMTNDNCAGAVLLGVSSNANCTTSASGTTVGATQSLAGCSGTADDDVWYRFVAIGTSHVITVTPGTISNVMFEVFNGSCAGASIACINNTTGSNAEVTTLTGLTVGTTYYVRVYSFRSNVGDQGTFSICITSPPTNDNCNTAIPLTVTNSCSYGIYSNYGATASAGVPAPGCANYQGGDVWFSAVVPATGELDVTIQAGVITNSGMAFYSGTCGALTLLDCDGTNNGSTLSTISMTGLTPGQTIYIRVWEKGNDNNGSFGICATTPSCPSPSDLLANILSATSVTVNWNASTPPAAGGYQYYISTTNTPPTAGTTPTGTTPAGVIGATLTGLTPGQKYYFWVRSFCGGSDTSTWFGPTNYTPCAVGNGTGTTTLNCPSVVTGGVGLSGGTPPAQNCSSLTCVNLEANFLQLNQPTTYTVSSIPYAPPYQFTCLQNPVSVNVDDIWSPMINLPFNFCFYGNNYSKCLIGSNGVITFDTTTYSPGGYNGWSFANNLPTTSLFKNTIFGVYHDIDPSKGGQVGYELITLNSGCRALVASWNDIPMYSAACSSQLYTGMIVLYENSNIIDVYIKEKNACSTWNDGNAVVGIQNANATAAVVAPSRNSLDTDWTVTNEAWRFTPSGTSLTSIQWYEGNVATGTPISSPTPVTVGDMSTSTISVCPTVSTLYTAEVTYSRCNGIIKYSSNTVVTVNGNKVWNGSVSTDWNTANNWTPNTVPTAAECVIVPSVTSNRYPIIANTPDGLGYNLLVKNGAQLTVNSNKNLTITDKVTVQPTGIFTLNNSSSLIQINNILNSGNIIYKRTSPSIRTLDYVYWSSPVANFAIGTIPAPYIFGPTYTWNTTVANANGGQGTWQNFSGNMVAGKGYIARAPGTSPFNNSTYNPLTGTFTGVPNNGTITVPIERGNDQNTGNHYGTNGVQITNLSDNWNLLGNPYASALRGSQFLFDNNTKIEGNIRLWTHGNLPVYTTNPFYNSFVYNYTSGDYLTYNFTGTSCCPAAPSDLFIGSGQGFFVQMIDGPQVLAASNVTVEFNNNQRNAAFDNSIFYKSGNPNTYSMQSVNVANLERNRIWLDLINANGQSDRTLFGYIENATMGIDSFFDCITQNSGGTLIFSEIGDTKFNIQGRSLPFNVNDEVPIGINAPAQGDYTIAIAAVDGLFNDQDIYLKDNLLNITHNLKTSPYHFNASQAGGISNRFKVVYVDSTLGTGSQPIDQNSIKVITNDEVAVSSSNLTMESVAVYNLLGQKLGNYDKVNSNYIVLSNLHKNNTTLFLNIKLQTGETVIKKIIY